MTSTWAQKGKVDSEFSSVPSVSQHISRRGALANAIQRSHNRFEFSADKIVRLDSEHARSDGNIRCWTFWVVAIFWCWRKGARPLRMRMTSLLHANHKENLMTKFSGNKKKRFHILAYICSCYHGNNTYVSLTIKKTKFMLLTCLLPYLGPKNEGL